MTSEKTNLWWGPPKNFSERKNERKISWLELFYDLVYVAVIGQLTHQIALTPNWHTLGYSFLLFSLIFWSWVNGSQYYDLHGNDGVRTRLFTFFQMLAVAAVAITIQDSFEGYHKGFAVAFAVVQLIVTYLWWSVGYYDPSHRAFNIYYTVNYSIAFVLLIISVFTTHGIASMLWIGALLLNLTPPIIGGRRMIAALKKRGQIFTASATIVERFGLFTIIVLAESILGIVTGVAEVNDKHTMVWLAFILAMLIAFLLWNLYFDMTSEQETKQGYWYMQWFVFLHFPLLASLSVVGACLKVSLSNVGVDLAMNIQWMLCGSIATILYMIVGITRIMEEDAEDRSYIRPVSGMLVVTGLCLLAIPLFGQHLTALTFLTLVSVILLIPVFIGVKSWVRYKFLGNN